MKAVLSYLGVAIGAVMLALLAGSQFMPSAMSQTRPMIPPAAPVAAQPYQPTQPKQPAQPYIVPTPQAPPLKMMSTPVPQQPLPPVQSSPINAPTPPSGNNLTPPQMPSSNLPQKPSDLLVGIIEDYTYNANDRRDPFMPYEVMRSTGDTIGPVMSPLQKYDIDQLKLVGVIWDVHEPKAMILDPTGKGYVIHVSEKMGRHNGYVARIREGEIVVIESFKADDGKVSFQTKIVKLTPE